MVSVWNSKFKILQLDKTASSRYYNLMKQQVDEVNIKLTEWKGEEIEIWQTNNLMNQQMLEIESWQKSKLMKSQVGEVA